MSDLYITDQALNPRHTYESFSTLTQFWKNLLKFPKFSYVFQYNNLRSFS